MELIIYWLVTGLAVAISSYLLPGVTIKNYWTALVVAVVLGLVNILIRPFILFLTLPINILTLGLFTFVVNTLMILLVSAIVSDFKVRGFLSALLFGIILAIVNYFLIMLFPGV